MGPTQSGALKRKIRSNKTQETGPKKPKSSSNPKPGQSPTGKQASKGIKRKFVELVHNDERDLSEDDLKEFDDYQHFGEFLHSLDPQDLARKTQRQSRYTGSIPYAKKNESSSDESDIVQHIHEGGHRRNPARSQELSTKGDSKQASEDHEQEISTNSDSDSAPEAHENYDTNKEPRIPKDPEFSERFFKSSASRESNRLPIKLGNGRVQPIFDEPLPMTKSESTPKRTDEHKSEFQISGIDSSSINSSAERLLITQETLAKVALVIIEDPEENIGQISRLREIQQKGDLSQRKFAILTLTSVFRDIIPGYRIRPLSDTEKAEKVTKEVRRLRNFEQVLVEQYQGFVTSLTVLSKTARKNVSPDLESTTLKVVAITAACSLIGSVPHFNFRTELLNILINQVCRKRIDVQFMRSRQALQTLFSNDFEGEASVDAMRLLCKKMKDREYQVDPSTLELFMHLKLLGEMEARGSIDKVDREKVKKKERQFRTKKLKKLIKDHKEVEKDLDEARATVNIEVTEKLQGDILKLVFSTFFRILKDRIRNLMGAALEGLAKFAGLVNVDFFGDLLEVLKEVMSEDPDSSLEFNTREILLCIVTAFTLLSGQATTAETVNLDLTVFLRKLYHILLPLAIHAGVETSENLNAPEFLNGRNPLKSKINVLTETEMLLRALDAIFFKHRTQGSDRLSAFVKRLFVASLHVPEKSSAAVLELNNRLATRYSKVHALFSTAETAGDGQYNGYTDNFELSSPATTSVWEIALIRKHFSPRVRKAGVKIMETLLDTTTNHP